MSWPSRMRRCATHLRLAVALLLGGDLGHPRGLDHRALAALGAAVVGVAAALFEEFGLLVSAHPLKRAVIDLVAGRLDDFVASAGAIDDGATSALNLPGDTADAAL